MRGAEILRDIYWGRVEIVRGLHRLLGARASYFGDLKAYENIDECLMRTFGVWILVVSLIVGLSLGGAYLARHFQLDFELTVLALLVGAYFVAVASLEMYRYRLRTRLKKMNAQDLAAVEEMSPEARYAIPAPGSASPRLTLLVGIIVVIGPIIPIMLGPLALLQALFLTDDPVPSLLCLALGFVLAWTWWSITTSIWRWWATARRGMPPDEVQWRGEEASLLWPKNHRFERTEFANLLSLRKRKR